MSFCSLHETELNRTTKNKGVPYHWIEKDNSNYSNMCYGDQGKSTTINTKTSETVEKPQLKLEATEDPDKMSKDEWAEKDKRIARLTLAKTFIQAGVDFDNAVQNADLLKWEKYIQTGKVPATKEEDEIQVPDEFD